MSSTAHRLAAKPGEAPWYHNPLAFFGLTLIAVFLGGYLAFLAAGWTLYAVTKGRVASEVEDLKQRLSAREDVRDRLRR
jgi:hypothetical protein